MSKNYYLTSNPEVKHPSGENKKRSTLSTGLENLEEINEIIPLRNNTFTCFSDH